jgi:hypothetical protein
VGVKIETGKPPSWPPSPIPAPSQGGTRGGTPAFSQGNDRIATLVISLLTMRARRGLWKKNQAFEYRPVICVFSTGCSALVSESWGVFSGFRRCPCHTHLDSRAPGHKLIGWSSRARGRGRGSRGHCLAHSRLLFVVASSTENQTTTEQHSLGDVNQ